MRHSPAADRVRLRLDLSARDLAFILHSQPSLPPYSDFPDDYKTKPNFFAAIGADRNWGDWLTLGAIFGIERPVTLTSEKGIPGDTTMTAKSTAVIRNNNIDTLITILPEGKEAAPQVAVKGSAKIDFGKIFTTVIEVFYSYDPNDRVNNRRAHLYLFSVDCFIFRSQYSKNGGCLQTQVSQSMADINKRVPDCDDDREGERGERGRRGRRGPTGPIGPVVADNVTIGGDGTAANPLEIIGPLLTYVFRPGATGSEAPGGNVFTDWALLMAALDATKFDGLRAIDFDNRFAPNPLVDPVLAPFLAFNTPAPSANGLFPCAIPPPPPGQAWDMRDVIWMDRGLAPGGASVSVQLWDGGPGRPCLVDNLKRIDMLLLNLIYNGKTVGNHPIVSSRSLPTPTGAYGIQYSGGRGRIFNTDPTAQPLWLGDIIFVPGPGDPNTQFVNLRNDTQLGNDAPLPAPLIELVAGAQFVTFGLDNFQIMNNCFKGPVGSTVIVRVQSAAQGGSTAIFSYSNPSFLGAFLVGWSMNAQRWRASTILTANGNAFHGDVTRVNTSIIGPVRVTLPRAGVIAPTTGTSPFIGSAVTVLDVGGNAAANNITVRAQVGDSINGNVEAGGGESDVVIATNYGSARFWNDGVGNWFVIT